MLKGRNLTKVFRQHASKLMALDNVSLSCEEGECVCLIGGNGAGKSSLLRIFATLLQPSSGGLEICGVDALRHPNDARRHIGYISASSGLYPRMGAQEFLEYFAALYGIDSTLAAERIEWIAELFQLHSYLQKRCGSLSTGMKQKLLIARMLIHDPDVLLLDEPATGLDIVSAREMGLMLQKLKHSGKAVIIASHNPLELSGLADRVVALKNGAVAADCRPEAAGQSAAIAAIENMMQAVAARD